MQTVKDIAALRAQIKAWRQAGSTIGFVPTMGNLHQGHLTLVEEAKQRADKVVVSVFVNPMQFDRPDDLDRYPRTLEADQQKLIATGVDLLFTPTPEIMYPKGLDQQTYVDVPGLSSLLEGASRPGHFRGVSTVVTKLFNLVQPDVACFGQKDYQQLALLKQMVIDLALDIEVIGVPTVRDSDGLAMSSRNGYLTSDQRDLAPLLYQHLQYLSESISAGKIPLEQLLEQTREQLDTHGFHTDSIDVVDAENLQPLTPDSQRAVVLIAAFLGAARLIDNQVVELQTAAD
ncbi:pantoate--beta-alanine ligase [Corallincola spongiicola]|uniref:Pantothenate synthetase n=1 Tax=Corallincola spongiicola TaxID=2520508 RepID=A0ABY1WSC2_9GAMM|nr:pantoate--beta-alanine ligase [Corallincola spongiicola]TAA47636.1 pantoate--beta-alanine ligase [Corallincola spongiicola]